MKKQSIRFGIGSQVDDGQATYEFYESEAQREETLVQLHEDARGLTDGRLRLYQRVLSLGGEHLAIEMPAATPVSYVTVKLQMPTPEVNFAIWDGLEARVELISGEVEIFPKDAWEKRDVQKMRKSDLPWVVMQNFILYQWAGRRERDRVFDHVVLADNRTGFRVHDPKTLRLRMLRAKALNQLKEWGSSSVVDRILNATAKQLLPVTN